MTSQGSPVFRHRGNKKRSVSEVFSLQMPLQVDLKRDGSAIFTAVSLHAPTVLREYIIIVCVGSQVTDRSDDMYIGGNPTYMLKG
jgi:hypothetical protein